MRVGRWRVSVFCYSQSIRSEDTEISLDGVFLVVLPEVTASRSDLRILKCASVKAAGSFRNSYSQSIRSEDTEIAGFVGGRCRPGLQPVDPI